MCGITGFISLDGKCNIELDILTRMNDAIGHRGPDADGFFFDQGIGFGHRRLSIIDVSAGQQPMFSDDKEVVIVFNGEIYNFLDINQELVSLGHHFKTHSDTETIIKAYQQWGVDCLDKLNGMFAFVIWDKQANTVFIARDRIGEKPFYYSKLSSNRIIFASELKALKQHPEFQRDIDPRAIEDYMTFGYVPEPKSLYKNTLKLEAGHYIHIKIGEDAQLKPIQYWDLPWQNHDSVKASNEDMIERLKKATDIRMMAEVPLGAFLSGGVDSSAIVAMMSQLQDEPVNTVAIGFDVPEFNESDFAQLVADRYRTDHTLEVVNHQNFDIINKLARMYDEPFADSSALPTFKVCEAAREKVTVCLSGDGGDELFVGYRRYRLHGNESKVRDKIPEWLRKLVFKPLAAIYPKADWAPQFLRAKTTFQSLSMTHWQAYLNSISKVRYDDRHKLYSPAFKKALAGYDASEVFARHVEGKSFKDPMKEAQYLDFKTWMPGDILTKVDRASMANSLEVRVPMLDHEFVEWAFTLDTKDCLIGKNGKANLKKALEPHLPSDNLYRDKMGFSIPLADWLRGPLKDRLWESLNRDVFVNSDLFCMDEVSKLFNEHVYKSFNHQDALWQLMVLSDVLYNFTTED